MTDIKFTPNYVFETSWEVCNKVGGIYTVISTKAPSNITLYKDQYILIGPDVWKNKYNREFIEDKTLFSAWHKQAENDGLYFRIGRWNIEGNPIAILVDFTPFFSKKDEIFKQFWEDYKLDSISGQWDYIEPTMFGYTAAKVIEHFHKYNVMPGEKVVAQFHEWMTGSGILYLKKNLPQVATVFTTHATVLGRCMAGNNLPLYRDLEKYNPDNLSNTLSVRAKFSMEKLSAVHADAFTTVSEITNRECIHFFEKSVDIITPNGFDDSFVPSQDQFEAKRQSARALLFKATEALIKQKLPKDDTLFIVNSGRYEFKNKGIDVFIDSLAAMNQSGALKKPVVAYLTIPADHKNMREDVKKAMEKPDFSHPNVDDYCTHHLNNPNADPIIQRLRSKGLRNLPEDKVKVVFVPCYLDGHDGIFNVSYYDLLIGFDASVFPSYYEPWGYTPLESTAFKIPTITTSLAGFGLWVETGDEAEHPGVVVIDRTDDNEQEVINAMAQWLTDFTALTPSEIDALRKNAHHISRLALWKNLSDFYQQAYSIAIEEKSGYSDIFFDQQTPIPLSVSTDTFKATPFWRKVMINSKMPENLGKLKELAMNLWWSWNQDAIDLFVSLDANHSDTKTFNPLEVINALSASKLHALSHDEVFLLRLEQVYQQFSAYMETPKDPNQPKVAYFCMEYGLHDSLKIYSGGLGILAGDYLKAASDSNVDMVGVGLLYRYGYFNQHISLKGEQIAENLQQQFSLLPIQPVRDHLGNWVIIKISLPGRVLHAKVWEVEVGRISLYLLDTDIDENSEADRSITYQLYGGDWDNRLKQELLLGIGGVRTLNKLNIKPDIFHLNEGHAALLGFERLRVMIEEEKKPFDLAVELVRSSSLFTTHTPVPAGHDDFNEDMMRSYFSHYPKRLEITWDAFMGLGRKREEDHGEKFSMSVLAAKLCQEMNGVSRIHGRVSREMFADMFNGFLPDELHIGYVTNGVHYKTWANHIWKNLYEQTFGKDFLNDVSNEEYWHNIYNVPNAVIKENRDYLRNELIVFAKKRLENDMKERLEDPDLTSKAVSTLNPNALTIGFARRFATYKRAHLLFKNLERLSKIVNIPNRPVQFIFAGKAHPADKAGQDLIKNIIEVSRRPEFVGKIIFLENYDVAVAKKMVQGVDVWMNTPTRPQEASGTSGEKAIMNGVLNLSVLDGWWAEGYLPNAGWALKEEQTYSSNQYQDQLDAETIYNIIEHEMLPAFYETGSDGTSEKWTGYIKNCIAQIAPRFTMKRQLDDYIRQYYKPLAERSNILSANDDRLAKGITNWKQKVKKYWDDIEVVHIKYPDSTKRPLMLGEVFKTEVVLNIKNKLNGQDIGVEVVFGKKSNDKVERLVRVLELKLVKMEGNLITFQGETETVRTGVYDFAYRIYPKNDLLPHRLDFNLIKWA